MPPCARTSLACSPVGFVDLCSCGSLHLGIGPLTRRIEPPAFRALAALVAVADRRLTDAHPATLPARGDA